MKQDIDLREQLRHLRSDIHTKPVSYTHSNLVKQLQAIDANPKAFSSTLVSKEFLMTISFILLGSIAVYFSTMQFQAPQQQATQNAQPRVQLLGVPNNQNSATTSDKQQSATNTPRVSLVGSSNDKNSNNANGTKTSSTAPSTSPTQVKSSDKKAAAFQITANPDGRPISLLNAYEPDDATLAKLGYVRYGNDSVVSYGKKPTGELWRVAYHNRDLGMMRSLLTKKDITPAIQNLTSTLFPAYVLNKSGGVFMFDEEAVGFTPRRNFTEVYLKDHNETAILEEIERLRKEAEGTFDKVSIWFAADPSYTVGNKRNIELKDISTPAGLRIRGIAIQSTEQEYKDALDIFMKPMHDAQERYKDSVVVLKIKVGKESYYLPYMPTQEFLSLLPRHDALQIRAELGNKEALTELRESYKGCRYLSFCSSSSGAIEDTEILGSVSESLRVKMQLGSERTLRIALYDINGQLLTEVDKGSNYAPGEHIIPLRVQSTVTGWYLLTITSDKGEKVSQRVVLGN